MDIAFTVSDGVRCEGPWTSVANCSPPMNCAEFIDEFEDVSEREETQISVIVI